MTKFKIPEWNASKHYEKDTKVMYKGKECIVETAGINIEPIEESVICKVYKDKRECNWYRKKKSYCDDCKDKFEN